MSVKSEYYKLVKLVYIYLTSMQGTENKSITLWQYRSSIRDNSPDLFTTTVSCSDIPALKRDDFFFVLIIGLLPLASP